jgi:hypothetical protein
MGALKPQLQSLIQDFSIFASKKTTAAEPRPKARTRNAEKA